MFNSIIVVTSRCFARIVWFTICDPDVLPRSMQKHFSIRSTLQLYLALRIHKTCVYKVDILVLARWHHHLPLRIEVDQCHSDVCQSLSSAVISLIRSDSIQLDIKKQKIWSVNTTHSFFCQFAPSFSMNTSKIKRA